MGRVDPTVFALGYLGIEMSRVSWPKEERRGKVGLSEYSRFQGLSCDSLGGSRWPARRLFAPLYPLVIYSGHLRCELPPSSFQLWYTLFEYRFAPLKSSRFQEHGGMCRDDRFNVIRSIDNDGNSLPSPPPTSYLRIVPPLSWV